MKNYDQHWVILKLYDVDSISYKNNKLAHHKRHGNILFILYINTYLTFNYLNFECKI